VDGTKIKQERVSPEYKMVNGMKIRTNVPPPMKITVADIAREVEERNRKEDLKKRKEQSKQKSRKRFHEEFTENSAGRKTDKVPSGEVDDDDDFAAFDGRKIKKEKVPVIVNPDKGVIFDVDANSHEPF
jgi:hypothetical protein